MEDRRARSKTGDDSFLAVAEIQRRVTNIWSVGAIGDWMSAQTRSTTACSSPGSTRSPYWRRRRSVLVGPSTTSPTLALPIGSTKYLMNGNRCRSSEIVISGKNSLRKERSNFPRGRSGTDPNNATHRSRNSLNSTAGSTCRETARVHALPLGRARQASAAADRFLCVARHQLTPVRCSMLKLRKGHGMCQPALVRCHALLPE